MDSDAAQIAIAPFDEEGLDKIVRTSYLALCAGNGQDARKTRELLAEIKSLENQRKAVGESERLIDSPLMATLAVQVREYTGRALPSQRADFLGKAVEAALNAGYAREADERRLLRQAVGGWENHRILLSLLALEQLKAGARNVTEPELRRIFNEHGIDRAISDAFIQLAGTRGGLLRKQPDERYWFIHLAIQQWLVAWRLVEQDIPAPDLASFFIEDGRITDEKWREIAFLVAGLRREHAGNTLGDTSRLVAFLQALAIQSNTMQLAPEIRFACSDVTVRAVEDNLGVEHPLHTQLTPLLAAMLEDDTAMTTGGLKSRLALGAYVTKHGDPRQHVITVDSMQLCCVPHGSFWMGDDTSEYSNERPAHLFDIPYDYWIGRYPITNAQFNQFVYERDDDGLTSYANPHWWTVAKQAGAWADGQAIRRVYKYGQLSAELQIKVAELRLQNRHNEADILIFRNAQLDLVEERSSIPAPIRFHDRELQFDERVRQFPNHPVAGVTWYESLAFCAWLEHRWCKRHWLEEGWHVTLPNEPEWEKAARGGTEITAPSLTVIPHQLCEALSVNLVANPNLHRQYPWGDRFSPEAGNSESTGINFTTPVGCFSSAAHPYGCQEMSGNVSEWTRSLYGRYDFDKRISQCDFSYPYSDRVEARENLYDSVDISRVLRGGAFDGDHQNSRCAARIVTLPFGYGNDVGFRVVCRTTA